MESARARAILQGAPGVLLVTMGVLIVTRSLAAACLSGADLVCEGAMAAGLKARTQNCKGLRVGRMGKRPTELPVIKYRGGIVE